MKLCLVKTSSMGDILHTLPALTDATKHIKNLDVHWVVEQNFAEIPRWHAAVKQVIPLSLRRWRKTLYRSDTWNEWKTYRTLLQQTRYDCIIDAQGLLKSALFSTSLARGKKCGYDRHCARESWASLFYDQCFFVEPQCHAVERIRQLFALALDYPLPTTQSDYAIAHHFSAFFDHRPYVVFIHSTSRQEKCWCNEQWRAVARHLETLGVSVRLPWGNTQEKRQAQTIAQGIKSAVVLPKCSLTELAKHIAGACAVLSVDTGLAHLTAALAKPNITLYGSTDPALIGTYGQHQYHIRKSTLQAVKAEDILPLLTNLL